MGPKSLKNALLLVTALLVVGSGVLISQVVIHRYSVRLLESAAARAENIAHKLALDAADRILINDRVALQKLLDDQMRSDPAVAYLFVVKDGQILSHTFKRGVPVNLIAANALTATRKEHLQPIVSQTGAHFLDIAWPIFSAKAGVLRLGLDEKPFRRQADALWLQMSLITLAVVALALLGGHLLIRRLTRPLLNLAAAAEKIDAGNLEIPVDVGGRLEVRKLGASFNAMLQRIAESTQRLKEYNRRLEVQNQELDRVQRQLRTSFAISQEITALPNLNAVCRHLLKTLQDVVTCRHLIMVVLGDRRESLMIWREKDTAVRGQTAYRSVQAALGRLHGMDFLPAELFGDFVFSGGLRESRRVGAFPLRHEGRLCAALLIGCPGDCSCVREELDVIDMILKQAVGTLYRSMRQEEEIRELRKRIEPAAEFSGMVGRDSQMQLIYKLIEDVAPTDATVLIQGESGTGKELAARAIHRLSDRRDNPFVVINCSAYPSTLLESELFGHERGAFTGALRRKAGRFEQADGGTVFLDEIGEVPPSAQIRLLRVLQSRKFERLGGESTVEVNVRILAATNKDLFQEVQKGHFREDLYYRLNVIPVLMPPLCERRNDIPLLAHHFLKGCATQQGKDVRGFTSEAMRLLFDYSWPGNVRELENSIEHAVVLTREKQIDASDLPASLRDGSKTEAAPRQTLVENEEKLMRSVLVACNWNKTEAAQRLGISRSTLYEKLKKYRIVKPTLH